MAGQFPHPGGRPPETIEIKEVRKLAQARTPEAFKVIETIMVSADKDATRLAAAITVLKLAGVDFDKVLPQGAAGATIHALPARRVTVEELRIAATQGQAR
jgi:hypothetical protein